MTRHSHETYQIVAAYGGVGEIYYRGTKHFAPTDSLLILHPGEVHTYSVVDGQVLTYFNMYVKPDLFCKVANDLGMQKNALPYFPSPILLDANMVARFRQCHIALQEAPLELTAQTLLWDWMTRMVLFHAADASELHMPGRHREAVRRAREYLEDHWAERASLEQLSRAACLSPFHLNRLFCREVGFPPHIYQMQIRIAHAKVMLTQGRPAGEVAAVAGFFDQTHFTKWFKRTTGVTPNVYAKFSKSVLSLPSSRPVE